MMHCGFVPFLSTFCECAFSLHGVSFVIFSLLVTVVRTAQQAKTVRFLHVAFNTTGDSFLAGDHHGNIYLFDISRNRSDCAKIKYSVFGCNLCYILFISFACYEIFTSVMVHLLSSLCTRFLLMLVI